MNRPPGALSAVRNFILSRTNLDTHDIDDWLEEPTAETCPCGALMRRFEKFNGSCWKCTTQHTPPKRSCGCRVREELEQTPGLKFHLDDVLEAFGYGGFHRAKTRDGRNWILSRCPRWLEAKNRRKALDPTQRVSQAQRGI